jgi:hypothetical protein
MTVVRATAVLLVFGAIALCLVCLRAEQTRIAARIQALEVKRVELRQASWEVQMEIARLKTPEQVTDRVERLRLNVLGPGPELGWHWGSGLAEAY